MSNDLNKKRMFTEQTFPIAVDWQHVKYSRDNFWG